MRSSALAVAIAALSATVAGAQDVARDGAAPAAPAAAATPSPKPAVPRGLELGPYGRPYASTALSDLPPETPRFRTEVEVHGKARDAATLTARLRWFMADSDLTRGATPATMSAPSIDEMREYRPHPPDSVDLVPVMRWITERLGGRR